MAMSEEARIAIRNPFRWLFEPTPQKTPENPTRENPDGSVPRNELTKLMVGLLGQNQLYGLAGGWFFHFLTNVLKIPPATVGVMTSIITVYDACNDPVAGSIIDKHRFKNGQKLVPWIKYTSPLIAVFAFLMFVNWGFTNTTHAAIYSIIVYLLWDALYSFQDASLWGLTAMISPHSRERGRSIQWAEVGTALGGLLPGLLISMFDGSGAFGLTQTQIYLIFGAVLCLGGGMLSLVACGVNERIPNSPKPESLLKNISLLRHNYILWLFVLSDVLNTLSPRISDVFIYQSLDKFRIGNIEISAVLTITILGAVTGIPQLAMKFFANKVIDRFGGTKQLMITARVVSIITRVIVYFIGINSLPALVLVYLVQMVDSIPNSVYSVAMRTMIADSVDYVEWKTGQRTEGITMSMRNFQSKICGSFDKLMQGYSLKFLQYDAHLIDDNIPQNQHFQTWKWPVYKLGPVIGLVMSLVPLLALKYPNSLKQQIESDLAARRNERRVEEEQSNAALVSAAGSMADNEAMLEQRSKTEKK